MFLDSYNDLPQKFFYLEEAAYDLTVTDRYTGKEFYLF